MGVTNGFLRLTSETFAELRDDAAAFERRCRDYDQPDYLDMDKAGWELLFVLNPASIEYDKPNAETPYPGIAAVLGGGETVHEDSNLGYGPAQLVAEQAISTALTEITEITLEHMTTVALESELLPEVLMCDVDTDMIKEYHWPYLQSLREFLTEAQQRNMAVLRY